MERARISTEQVPRTFKASPISLRFLAAVNRTHLIGNQVVRSNHLKTRFFFLAVRELSARIRWIEKRDDLKKCRFKLLEFVPGAGLEPTWTLPNPRDLSPRMESSNTIH
jgi:hypothetical protein